jgi:hypothetical protein
VRVVNTRHTFSNRLALSRYLLTLLPAAAAAAPGDVFNNVSALLQFHPEFSSLAALLSRVPGLSGAFGASSNRTQCMQAQQDTWSV